MAERASEQELIVHAFAPLRGKHAEHGWTTLLDTWRRSAELLGATTAVFPQTLSAVPPDRVLPDGAKPLAAAQNQDVDVQLVMRQMHDVAIFSLLFAAPDVTGLATGVQPGWIEFDRWWTELSSTDGLLGIALVFQCKQPLARNSLPAAVAGAVDWSREYRHDELVLWDAPTSTDLVRRLVVAAPVDRDRELSRWTWSRGDLALPPLARYLAQAAKLRHHIRVWEGDENWLTHLRAQVDVHVDEWRSAPTRRTVVGKLHGDEAGLAVATDRVDRMRTSVEASRSNMIALLGSLLPADIGLADWFLAQLDQESARLNRSRSLAKEIRGLITQTEHHPSGPRPGQKAFRLGFMLDVVQYTSRKAPEMERLQQRLIDTVADVLGELGLALSDTDHQGTGDGLVTFLPAEIDVESALPALLHDMSARLRQDNRIYRDRLRVRMALDVGPVGLAALGFSGTITSVMGRLLDSAPLRQAVLDHPDADLVAMISNRLHGYVVGEGAAGLDAADFTRADVAVKAFRDTAWLWVEP